MAEQRGPKPDGAVNPELDAMWISILRKAQQQIEKPPASPSTLMINFDGAGQVLTVGQGGILQVPFPCRILGCTVYSGIASVLGPVPVLTTAASIYVGLAVKGFWGSGSVPLNNTGVAPFITDAFESEIDIDGWLTDLQPGDLISYSLVSFTGTATFLTVAINVRKLDVINLGVSSVVDSGDTLTSSGLPVTSRF